MSYPGRAFVLTVSDRSARGERPDAGGARVAARLRELGFTVERGLVPDNVEAIRSAARAALGSSRLLVATGGTGIAPRDVTPQALLPLLDFEIPGLGEAMRAHGRQHTALADLSRSFGGVAGASLVLAVPGSLSGAIDSLDAVAPLLEHALESLAGAADHDRSLDEKRP